MSLRLFILSKSGFLNRQKTTYKAKDYKRLKPPYLSFQLEQDHQNAASGAKGVCYYIGEEDDPTAGSDTFQTPVEGHHCMN